MFNGQSAASTAWVARGLSGLLIINLVFGCSPLPSASNFESPLPFRSAAPADNQNPLTADLASVNIAQEILDKYDQGHKGFLTAAEAVLFQDEAGMVTAEFRRADRNGDGRLSQNELVTYFRAEAGAKTEAEVRSQSALLVGGLLLGTLTGAYLTYVGLKGSHDIMHPLKDTSTTKPQDLGMSAEDVTLKTDDGIVIKGWFIPSAESTSKTVLILHGHGDNKSSFLSQMAPWIHKQYNIFTFDFRNSGASGGDFTTLGPLEQKDLRAALDYLKTREQTKIGALGISMGAATAIEEAAGDPRLDAVVSDCAFDTLYDAIKSRVALRHYPLARQGAWMILKMTDLKTHMKLEEQDPLRHVAQIAPRPIFFIHGTEDRKTLPEDTQHLYDAALGPKSIWMVPGAGHAKSYPTAPAEYESRVLAFFEQALN